MTSKVRLTIFEYAALLNGGFYVGAMCSQEYHWAMAAWVVTSVALFLYEAEGFRLYVKGRG